MTNKEYFEKTFGYDGSIVAKVLPNKFDIGSCGYTDCRESCASRHFPRCPLWWTDEQEYWEGEVGMIDKNILISDLNDISEILTHNGYGGWCKSIQKAIDLLKWQQEIIRCKDCKYAPGNKERYTCKIRDRVGMYMKNPDYFFCADGERR